MGRWGSGNFDDDGALDYLGELTDALEARIEEVLSDPDRAALDEEGEAVVVPTVQILSVLCEHCKASPSKPETVAEWKSRYLAVFDDEAPDYYSSPQFRAERRQVIASTFDRLEAQARTFWQDEAA